MYEYSEHKNMYAVVDKTDVPTIMNTLVAEGAEEKCKELYEYTAKNVEMYIHMKDKVRWNGKDIEVWGCGRFLGPELSNSKTASILHRTQPP